MQEDNDDNDSLFRHFGSHKKMIIEYYDCVMIDRLLIDKSENLCLGGSSYFQIKSLANMSGKVELLKT